MRLIDADKFDCFLVLGKSEEFIKGVEYMLNKIDNAETIDIEECTCCEYRVGEGDNNMGTGGTTVF